MNITKSSLTRKQWLGLIWEMVVQWRLDGTVEYIGNPVNGEWTASIGQGSDIKIPSLDMEIECKFVNHKVYPSHIESSYKDRCKPSTKYKIICTNDKSLFSFSARNRLEQYGYKLMNLFEVEAEIFQLLSIRMKGRNNVKSTSLVKDVIVRLLGIALLLPFLKLYELFSKGFGKKLLRILHRLCLDTMALATIFSNITNCKEFRIHPVHDGSFSTSSTLHHNAYDTSNSINPRIYLNHSSYGCYQNLTSSHSECKYICPSSSKAPLSLVQFNSRWF